MACFSALFVAGCGSATSPSRQRGQDSRTVTGEILQIARGTNPRTLLIDGIQNTTDRKDECFIHYTARVVQEKPRVIRVEVLGPPPPPHCTANAVRGPCTVPVHLRRPYRGQKIIDAVTGRELQLLPRSQLC